MNDKGLTVVELIILIFMCTLIAIMVYALIKYGNKPVSEMPIWVYWLIGR